MPFGTLWLPVILSAVAVFLVSSILHMALKYHKRDMKALPNEEAVRSVLGQNLSPGIYFTPYCGDMKDMKAPAMKEKFRKGPVALITIRQAGEIAMGKHLALWFGFSLLVSFVAGYVARHTLSPGAAGVDVMRITGTVAFAIYGVGHISDAIWKGQPWSNTAREVMDGGIYALVTALTFELLWPGAQCARISSS